MSAVTAAERGASCEISSARVRPATYSMTMKYTPWASPASKTATMFGCDKPAACESLAAKPGQPARAPVPVRRKNLHGHRSLQAQVMADEDLRHTPTGQEPIESVAAVENRSRPHLSQS